LIIRWIKSSAGRVPPRAKTKKFNAKIYKKRGNAMINTAVTRGHHGGFADQTITTRKTDAERRSQRNAFGLPVSDALCAGRRSRLVTRALTWMLVTGVVLSLSAVGKARAEDWPSSPIRAIVPYSAGSAADIVPRIVFEQLTHQLGQPIVIENRPGASGTIGARIVAHAAPDGYMLLAASSGYTIAPATIANLPYDPVKDFVAIASLGDLPNVLVISPSKNIRTVQQLVAAAKVTPITFGTTGVGGPIHLTMERFRQAAGFQARIIPFKGAPEALTEAMAGRIDVYYAPILSALPFIQGGKLLPLAVSSRKRASVLPDVPTTLEAGYPNSDYNFWIGLFAPAKTPRAIVERLNAEVSKALATPAVVEKLEKIGVQPVAMTSEQFNEFVRQEFKTNAELAEAAGIVRH
jgi:tripartite-type tricarboxylate transporter receptor subunit TctC